MSCNGRFKSVEGGGLPEVTNYDFLENIPVRGISNRTFRFQEVFTDSSYLFNELTENGDFEVYTGPNTSGGILATGANFSFDFSGWIAWGDILYVVPKSGITIKSGEFEQVTFGDTFAQSLNGSYSVGLIPRRSSDLLGIFKTGIIIPSGSRIQLYLAGRLLAGDLGDNENNLYLYLEGYSGTNINNVVAVYDVELGTWSSSRPDRDTARIDSSFVELSYDIEMTNLGSTTYPDYFTLFVGVRSRRLDTFIVIDDVHIDQYMKKDAFTDVVEPTGYILQMTPDLGWHDVKAMFEEGTSDANPHLVTLGPYVKPTEPYKNHPLQVNSDSTVTITVPEEDFKKAVSTNYKKYLWRAVAVSPNGTYGDGGYPEEFEYIGTLLDDKFSVDEVWTSDRELIAVISGTRSRRVTIVIDDDLNNPAVEYPTATTWKYTIALDKPKKVVKIQARDEGGALSSYQYVEIEISSTSLTKERKLWNIFDEFGLLVDLERYPDESNEHFVQRIKDAFQNPGSHFIDGVSLGGARELSLTRNDQIVRISLSDEAKEQDNISATIYVDSSEILVFSPFMVNEEDIIIDSIEGTANLSKRPFDEVLSVKLTNGKSIDLKKVFANGEDRDIPVPNQITIDDERAYGKQATVRYNFYEVIDFKSNPTVKDVVNKLKDIKTPAGDPLFSVEVDAKAGGNESSLGLVPISTTISKRETLAIAWSPVYLKPVSDRMYRQTFVENDEPLQLTDYYKYIQELKDLASIRWDNAVFDISMWDSSDSRTLGFDHIPTQFDPKLHNLKIDGFDVTAEEALAKSYSGWRSGEVTNSLLEPYDFMPGVAHTDDLRPDIHITFSQSPEIIPPKDVMSRGGYKSSSFKLFSGNK